MDDRYTDEELLEIDDHCPTTIGWLFFGPLVFIAVVFFFVAGFFAKEIFHLHLF